MRSQIIPRPGNAPTGAMSTANRIFSRGRRMTSVLSNDSSRIRELTARIAELDRSASVDGFVRNDL